MKYFLTLPSGRELELEVLDHGPGRASLLLDGRTIEADYRDVDRLGQYAVRLDEQSYASSIEARADTDLTVTIAGESFRVRVVDERERAAQELAPRAASGESIEASMPGIVVSVEVEVGQVLEPGDQVLVLEAMKMQNAIRSEHGGLVEEILIDPGQAVAGGQMLVRIGPAPESED